MRNRVLTEYMHNKQQVPAEQFSIAPYGVDTVIVTKGRHRYAISMEFEGEQIQLAEDESTEEPAPVPTE